jgi:hypothetical protein
MCTIGCRVCCSGGLPPCEPSDLAWVGWVLWFSTRSCLAYGTFLPTESS